ncbi:uncharacterized protein LOC135075990 [Ostrinia nubilalis]|uniref:uncharacterized protein LOC135075990 n=1 Tax=Ostrinia nubilalis TaxID=29057 RepID=UPI0030823AFB
MPVTRSRSGGSRVGATESTSEYTMSTAVADEQGTSQTETTASQRTVPVQRAAPGQGERTQAPLPHTSAQPPLAEQQRRAAQRPLSTLGPAQPPLRTDQRPPQPATGAGEPTLQEQRRQAELRTRPVSSPESPPPAEQGPTRLERPAAPARSTAAPPRSTATTKKSKRTRKLMEAREELLRLQVKLAAAKVAALEADSDSEEDVDTVMEEADHNARVNNWLDTSVPPMPIATEPPLAIASEPHRAPEPPPPLGDIEDRRPQAIEVPQAPAGAGAPAPLHHQVDLSELASAIAQAARSGQHNNNSKMFAELPYFGGSHHEWLSFKAAYFETQSGFTDLENLTRLRRSLKSRAREAVESLLIYNSNPRDVMKILEARFGRPDAIAVAEMEKIRSLPRLADSPRDLCIFASRVTNIVATLKTIGKQRYLLNPEIAKLTMEKLPPAMKYRWYDFAAGQPTDEADIEKLARFLNHEAEICGPYAQPEGVSEPAANRRNHKTFNAQQYEAVNSERHNSESERQYSERQNSERRNSERQNSERQNSDRENSEMNRKCVLCSATGHSVAGCAKWRDSNTSQRWDLAKEKRLCFRCLRFRARGHNCKVIKCNIEGCENVHHRTLHYSKRSEEPSEVVGSTWTGKGTQAFLKIVPVQIRGPRKRIDTHALLDDGSTVTLIDEDLAQQAGLRGPREPLHIEAIGSARVDTSASRRLNITLNRSGQGKQHRIRARTIQNLKLSPQSVKLEDIVRCEHLSDIQESVVLHSARPQILIGQDNWHLLVAQEQRIGKRHQPIASLTPLGWVLHGACSRTVGHRVHFTQEIESEERLNMDLKHFFSLEALTIAPKLPHNDPEARALKILKEKTTRLMDGRFQTGLLWKNEDIKMPENRDYALRRLEATEKKIEKDPEVKGKVIEQMEALVEKGYAELAPVNSDNDKRWYLPCFPVFNPQKPGKIRMVHDAAAKTKGMALNDALLTGPDLLQSLPGVLMKMRQHRVAVSADIAEMFLQVKIIPEDRDALRYLWRGCDRTAPPQEYRMTSLIFEATSSPATAIYVKNRNAEEFDAQYPKAAAAVRDNHYMDDYIQSFENEESAIEIAAQVRDIHRRAHFHLRKWISNSPRVLQELEEEQALEERSLGPKNEKVLGMIWKTSSDALKYNLDLSRLPDDILLRKPTKRQALQVVMSLFDPLGLVSPVTVQAKQILQEIWRRSTAWDEHLQDDLAERWAKWVQQLEALRAIEIPRCYPHFTQGDNLQLHVFVDASETAYAAALYWRVEDNDGRAHTTLVLAKSRVAPLKTTSIPRLELQAAVMGTRMASCVLEEHDRKPTTRTFWTDSRTVLTWLRTGARSYKPFVAHRIAEIEENTKIEEWRWVPTKMNVADDGTRDVPRDFDSEHRWFNGPSFLRDDPATWPTEERKIQQDTGEERANLIDRRATKLLEVIPQCDRFSRWERFVRTTARVLQFVDRCRPTTKQAAYARTRANKVADPTWRKQQSRDTRGRGHKKEVQQTEDKFVALPAELLIRAEDLIVRACQEDSFREEIHCLSQHRRVNRDSKLFKIAVELVDGLLTIKTRIAAAEDVPEAVKRPPVLDGRHHIARLYIGHVHRSGHHQGVEATINQCRQRFHILGLRPTARSIVHQCTPCRRRRWAPPAPPTGDHPAGRLAHHQRAFTFTGVDYFGPLLTTVGRATKKTYVALFTCLTTRAVHLEMAASLTTDSAVMALRRFVARRGCPRTIWSDNGTNLHGAERELRRAIDNATEEEAAKRRITWRFIPPGAPFMGGAWERLVRSVKTALSAVMDSRPTSEETLATLLAEVEMTVNSRPLTHVSVDPQDPETLTPNHFLLLGPAHAPPAGETSPQDLLGKASWRTAQRLADMFWARWLREYLPELQHRREPHGKGPAVQLGDVVLIADNTLPRNTWPLGRIVATYPGPDDIVRAVDVQTKGGILRRPTKKLVVLQSTAEPANVLPTE